MSLLCSLSCMLFLIFLSPGPRTASMLQPKVAASLALSYGDFDGYIIIGDDSSHGDSTLSTNNESPVSYCRRDERRSPES